MMHLLQTVYPYVLAGVNVAVGWLLLSLLESGLGVVLLAAGLLVVLGVLCETVTKHTPVTRRSP